ncbi:MAG: hypothetical protein H3C34_08385 [Caldilineaceae bacterium]|nr:hypothetical protein [Caldilineaceae bacterium]
MTMTITLGQCMRVLEANRLAYRMLRLTSGLQLLVMERGGRILGPFRDEDDTGLFWLNPAWASTGDLEAFLQSGDWNLGGERLWISPEIQYLVSDRRDFWGTVAVPAAMDPGTWRLDAPTPGQLRLRQEMTLTAYNLAVGCKSLRVERILQAAPDPLASSSHYEALRRDVIYGGYEQVVTLAEQTTDAITSQAWSLIQLRPGGQILIPCSPHLEITDYNEPVDAAHCTHHGHWVSFKITGARRYKVGLRATQTFGRLGYFHPGDNGHGYLIVRSFFNNPSSLYSEEPAHLPGSRGDSIHIYNDGGMFGGFGELEIQGQTIGGPTGRANITDQQLLWIYLGPQARLATIAAHLLGVTVAP